MTQPHIDLITTFAKGYLAKYGNGQPAQVAEDRKTCHRCKTELVPGKALVNTLAGLPDFPGDNSPVTVSPTGEAVLIDCQKCPNCGQSYTS